MTTNPITKGDPRGGRKPGQTNKMTRAMKKALVLAAENSIHSRDRGKSLQGYCTYLADVHPPVFAGLLGRLIPIQAKVKPDAGGLTIQNIDITMSLGDMVSAFENKVRSDYRPKQLAAIIEQEDVEVIPSEEDKPLDEDADNDA